MAEHDPQAYYLTLLRHGESEGNAARVLQGQTDFPLNQRGREQAQALGNYWKRRKIRFDLIISSTLARASQTAEILAAALQIPVELDPAWMERDNGALAGTRMDDPVQRQKRPAFIHPYLHIGETGESQVELYLRAGRNLQKLLDRQPGRYLVVSHSGLLNMATYAILGLAPQANFQGPRFRLRNTAFAEFRYRPYLHEWNIEGFNLHPHWQEQQNDE